LEAESEDEAERAVVALLRRDSDLSLSSDTPGREHARLFVEEIVAVTQPGEPNAGFTFFNDPGVTFYED